MNWTWRPWILSLSSLCLPSVLLAAEKHKAFDDQPVTWEATLQSPMDTLAGMTDFAKDINHVYGITTWVMVLIFFLVSIPIIYCLWRFRVKESELKGLKPPKQIHGHPILEVIWTVVPVILLVIIWLPTRDVLFRQYDGVAKTRANPDAVHIKVIGHQWWWEFRYLNLPGFSEQIVTASELHLPEQTPVVFEITSDDVIHSFWIPAFGGKIDAMPGPEEAYNYLYYTTPVASEKARTEGGGDRYQGQCVELCGASHALMRFVAIVHPKEEFTQWAKTYQTAPKVDSEVERKGEEVFSRCIACHSIHGTPSASIPGKKIGPNLTNFGSRATLGAGTRANTVENLRQWINHPETIKPGSLMPGQALNDEELEAVIAYIRNSTIKAL